MKFLSLISILSLLLIATSCKKNSDTVSYPVTERKIRYVLSTDQDFSGVNINVAFTVFINDETNNRVWDSLLPSMKLKDIPSQANSLVVEKAVPGNVQSLLKVGFLYTIENIGSSQYIDTSNAGSTLKVVNFNF